MTFNKKNGVLVVLINNFSVCPMDRSELIRLVGQKTENLFHVKGLCCSEAVIECLNRGFGGDLPDRLAISLGAGLCGGMGGGESVCGALSGAVVVLGAISGPGCKGGLSRKKMRLATKQLHDEFKNRFKTTVCCELIKDYSHDRQAKMLNCGELTAEAGRITVGVLLDFAPKLMGRVNLAYLQKRDTKITKVVDKIKWLRGAA